MTTQELAGLRRRRSTETLVLDARATSSTRCTWSDDGEGAWFTVEPGTARALVAWLGPDAVQARVEVADVTGEWAVPR